MSALPVVPEVDRTVGVQSHPRCLDRRRFLQESGLLGVATLLAAACGDGQIGNSVSGPSLSETVTVTLSQYPALNAVGGIARVNGSSTPIAVVRASSTQYRAFSMVCPHQQTTINIVNGASFRCPNHGATFAASGAWTGGERTSGLREYTAVTGTNGTLVIS